MELKFTKVRLSNKFQITVETDAFSTSDNNLMSALGEPLIEVGGTIKDDSTPPVTRDVLSSSLKKLKSDFPFFIEFINSDYEDGAQNVADAYVITLTDRITTALTALRVQSDTFSTVEIVTI
jgi:hypothetical protein